MSDTKNTRFLTGIPILQDELVGREYDLERLEQSLTKSNRVVLVNGMGGIGKTTLATAYVQQHRDRFQHIAWLKITEDLTSSILSDTVLINNLGVTLTGDAAEDVKLVLNKLSNLSGPSLLVVDNADEKLAPYRNYLPQAPDWQVLITSRKEIDFAEILSLDLLEPEAARKLFYNHYLLDKNDAVLEDILVAIDYHTLTIELLAKIAQDCQITSLEQIAKLLQDRGLKIGRQASVSTAHSSEKRIERLFPYLLAIFKLGDDFTDSQIHLLQQLVGLPPLPIPIDHLFALLLEDKDDEEKKINSELIFGYSTEKEY